MNVKDGLSSFSKQELQAFAENVWTIDGPNIRDFGLTFTTRMMAVRLIDGSVWVNSPVPVPFETLKQITASGQVKYILAATPRHVWRLEGWHVLFPEAQLWAPRATPFTLKKGDLPFTGILSDVPERGWADDFDQLAFKGSPFIEEILFFHKKSRTVILDDLIQINLVMEGTPRQNALFQLDGAAQPYGGVPLDIRLAFTNRKLACRSLEELFSWNSTS